MAGLGEIVASASMMTAVESDVRRSVATVDDDWQAGWTNWWQGFWNGDESADGMRQTATPWTQQTGEPTHD